jgi:cytochrome c551/c552
MKISSWISALCLSLAASVGAAHAATPKMVGQSLHEYAEACADMIGQIPAFDCTDGTIVPITVDGKTPTEYTQDMTCDRPALLPYGPQTFGQCTPYSRILNFSRNKVQISAFCRREQLRDPKSPMFDEVDIIAHSADSGKTCWFHAEGKPGQRSGFDASRVPPPNEKVPPPKRISANNFWWTPGRTAQKNCASCHDADPFMYSPWIGQVWHKVPTDPLGKYSNIGKDFAAWHSSGISTRDNTCVGCHRIGNQASCSQFIPMATGQIPPKGGNALAKSYPLSHWMPVNNDQTQAFWNKANLESLQKIMTCCDDPKNPICTIKPIITPDKKK